MLLLSENHFPLDSAPETHRLFAIKEKVGLHGALPDLLAKST
jgi:hypothetical protein